MKIKYKGILLKKYREKPKHLKLVTVLLNLNNSFENSCERYKNLVEISRKRLEKKKE